MITKRKSTIMFFIALLVAGCNPRPPGGDMTPQTTPTPLQDFEANARDYLPRLNIQVQPSGLMTENTTTDPQKYLILSIAVTVTNIGNRDINHLKFVGTYTIPGVYSDVQVVKPFELREVETKTLKKDGGKLSFVIRFKRSPISEQGMNLAESSRPTNDVKLQEVGFAN